MQKRNLVVIVLAIIAVLGIGASVGIVMSIFMSPEITKQTGNTILKSGDQFTYKLEAISHLQDTNAVNLEYLSQYNTTEYYKITIAQIQESNVTLIIEWKFTNGTIIPGMQTVDLATGAKSDPSTFALVYASNLKAADLLRPSGSDGFIVNGTTSTQYSSGTRETNYCSVNTQTSERSDLWEIFFDKQCGMVVNLNNIQTYNNPKVTITMVWKIVDSNLWQI